MFFSRLMANTIFYPTLWWNMLLGRVLKVRNWWDKVDEHVIVGAFPFARDVTAMAADGVKAVVNTCEEYAGPVDQYQQHQIEQFRMPTVDFTHPSLEDVTNAVQFIRKHVEENQTVYVHCKAGRARSATVAICWLIQSKQIPAAEAQQILLKARPHINPRLTERPVVRQFESQFLKR